MLVYYNSMYNFDVFNFVEELNKCKLLFGCISFFAQNATSREKGLDNTTWNTIQCTATTNLNFTTLKVFKKTVDRCWNIKVPGLGPGTHGTRQHIHYSAKPNTDLVAHKTKRQGRRYVSISPKLTFLHSTCSLICCTPATIPPDPK